MKRCAIFAGFMCFAFLLMVPSARAEVTAPLLKATPLAEEQGLRVSLGDITDNRTTGKHFARLEIELKTEGDALAQAFGAIKPVVTAAVDDTGRSLIKDDGKTQPMFWSFDKFSKSRTSLEDRVELLNPARKATSISFVGYVDVFNPMLDPAAVFTVQNLPAKVGQPLLPAAFQQTGLELTVLNKALADKMKQENAQAEAAKRAAAPETLQKAGEAVGQALGSALMSMFGGMFSVSENDLLFVVKDPKRQIAHIEVQDAAGMPIKTGGGRSISEDSANGTIRYTLSFAGVLPADAQLKLYFATPKSLQRVPFKYESVRLP